MRGVEAFDFSTLSKEMVGAPDLSTLGSKVLGHIGTLANEGVNVNLYILSSKVCISKGVLRGSSFINPCTLITFLFVLSAMTCFF